LYDFSLIKNFDSETAQAMESEINRQSNNIELIASENFVTKEVMAAVGSPLTNKYAEGYPNDRHYGGCEKVDVIEEIAINRAKKLFNCEYANVQPHSGSQANMAVFFSLLKPNDTILSMSTKHGGHSTHGDSSHASADFYKVVQYGLDENCYLNYEDLKAKALLHKPKLIIAGASCYSRIIDFKRISEVAKEVGAIFLVDMAHIAGLIAAGLHPSPFPYADVVTSTTHKTLRGPRGGLILTNDKEIFAKINEGIFPMTQGGPLVHVIAGKAVAFKEALTDDFKKYSKQVADNSKIFAKTFMENGFPVVTGGTDNHLFLVSLENINMTGKQATEILDSVKITGNAVEIPFLDDDSKENSGIRLGTPAMTTRGFTEKEFIETANIICDVLKDYEKNKDDALRRVEKLISAFPLDY